MGRNTDRGEDARTEEWTARMGAVGIVYVTNANGDSPKPGTVLVPASLLAQERERAERFESAYESASQASHDNFWRATRAEGERDEARDSIKKREKAWDAELERAEAYWSQRGIDQERRAESAEAALSERDELLDKLCEAFSDVADRNPNDPDTPKLREMVREIEKYRAALTATERGKG